jgi:O-antigen/teichoic acid export membrane protein
MRGRPLWRVTRTFRSRGRINGKLNFDRSSIPADHRSNDDASVYRISSVCDAKGYLMAVAGTTVRARIVLSVVLSVVRSLLGFLTGLLVARGLGPADFGTMSFLLGTFLAARQLTDMGSSTAFFTFLSRRPRSRTFVGYFAGWMALQFLVPLLAVGLLLPQPWLDLIWRGEHRSIVILAFLAAYMQGTLWPVVTQMAESQRLTYRAQGVGLGLAMAHFAVVGGLWLYGGLAIPWVLTAIALEWFVGTWLIVRHLRFHRPEAQEDSPRSVLAEFAAYCLPLVPYAWLSFAYEFADRWLLQAYGGSVQQAFYAVAAQFGNIAAIATSSILNVFWKEIAEAHHRGDIDRVRSLYRKVSRVLMVFAASVSGLLIPWAEDILRITLGEQFIGGAGTLAIMLIYPIHQSMGQVGGAMLYATGQVRIQTRVGIVSMAVSIVTAYFVLAPVTAAVPGLGLASVGLAVKIVVVQFVAVMVIGSIIARNLKLRFDWYHQFAAIVLSLLSGWGSREFVMSVLSGHVHWVVMFAVAAVLHFGLIALAIALQPWLVASARR